MMKFTLVEKELFTLLEDLSSLAQYFSFTDINVTFNSISAMFVGVLSGVVIGENQRHAG
jgi:hypothetical protein